MSDAPFESPLSSVTHENFHEFCPRPGSAGLCQIVDWLPSAIILVTVHNGGIYYINTQARKVLGLPPDVDYPEVGSLPDYLTQIRDILMAPVPNLAPRSEVEILLPHKEDPASTLGYTLQEVRILNCCHPMRCLIFSDITQVLRAQEEAVRMKEELYQTKKLASMGTMIAGVAHELNHPLIGISMSLELVRMGLARLADSLGEENDERRQFYQAMAGVNGELDYVAHATRRATVLIKDLLDYSKPPRMNLEPILLPELVEWLLSTSSHQPSLKKCQFQLQIPEADVCSRMVILGDRIRLEQVFFNLFKNAGEASTGDTALIDIVFETLPGPKGEMVRARVSDHGCGMSPAILERLFEPFFTTKGRAGVGLGLSVSYRSLELMGGHLSVSSEVGVGTTFYIDMPLYDQKSETMDGFVQKHLPISTCHF
jgi:signal transduction histidine kinase